MAARPLKQIRTEEAFLSQQELATKAKVAKKTINDIENGKIDFPQFGTIRAISKALGVNPAEVEEFANVGKNAA